MSWVDGHDSLLRRLLKGGCISARYKYKFKVESSKGVTNWFRRIPSSVNIEDLVYDG